MNIEEEIRAIYERYGDKGPGGKVILPRGWQARVDELRARQQPQPRVADVITIGWDPAKAQDYSAIAALGLQAKWHEVEHRWVIWRADCLRLERMAIGTPYPEQIRRVIEMRKGIIAKAGREPNIFLDASGLGEPLLDFAAEQGLTGVYAVTITGGNESRCNWHNKRLHIPKAELVGGLSVLIFGGLLKLPRKYRQEVIEELSVFRADRRPSDGRPRLEAAAGYHDDLVSALALAALVGPPPPPRSGAVRYA